MTLEQNIERIANALEVLAQAAGGNTPEKPVQAQVPHTVSETRTSVIQPPPVAPVVAPVAVGPQNAEAIPANGEQLRALAASVAQDLGKDAKTAPKVLVFTNWVASMLQPYGVAKLIEVRPEQIPAVAREIYAWARKEGVNA